MPLIFVCKKTRLLYETGKSKKFHEIIKVALRKLDMLDAAVVLEDLRVPPGNKLEALLGDRVGQHSIRVNAKWRICFVWDTKTGSATSVEIVDYH